MAKGWESTPGLSCRKPAIVAQGYVNKCFGGSCDEAQARGEAGASGCVGT
jgi:hypothetical protein